jgi:hypothetical protein
VAISDRTRKRLWGKAGARCAKCKRRLIERGTQSDGETIVGDECHIVARRPRGPRGSTVATAALDGYDNLILLCVSDHRVVDSQRNTYTEEVLQSLKARHEAWIEQTLAIAVPLLPSSRRRRTVRLTNARVGTELLGMVAGFGALEFHHPEPREDAETEAIAEFSEAVHDLEIYDELRGGERVRLAAQLTDLIGGLGQYGLLVWCGEYTSQIPIPESEPMRLRTAVVAVRRMSEDAERVGEHLRQIEDALLLSGDLKAAEAALRWVVQLSELASDWDAPVPLDTPGLGSLRDWLGTRPPGDLPATRELAASAVAERTPLRSGCGTARDELEAEVTQLRRRTADLRQR